MCMEKMFHQFHVSREDGTTCGFSGGKTGTHIQNHIQITHEGAPIWSIIIPDCANYGMKHLASQHGKKFPSAASFIRKHFYIESGLMSVDSVGEAITTAKETQALCAKGKLHLHKFLSNNREVLDSINIIEHAAEVKNVDLNHDDLPVQRVLGIRWDIENDSLSFKVSL